MTDRCESSLRGMRGRSQIHFSCICNSLSYPQVVAEWRKYVRPVHHPVLSAFCTELTGIEQASVDAGERFDDVLPQALHFLHQACGDAPVLVSAPLERAHEAREVLRGAARVTSEG